MIKGMLSGVLGPIISSFCVLHLPNEDLTVSPTFVIFSFIYFKRFGITHYHSLLLILERALVFHCNDTSLLALIPEESDGLDPEICVMVFTLNDLSTLCIISVIWCRPLTHWFGVLTSSCTWLWSKMTVYTPPTRLMQYPGNILNSSGLDHFTSSERHKTLAGGL